MMTPAIIAVAAAALIVLGFAFIPTEHSGTRWPVTFVAHAHCSPAVKGSDVPVFFKIYSNTDDILMTAVCMDSDAAEVDWPCAVPSLLPMQGVSADLMLINLHHALKANDEITLLLQFEFGGDVEAVVRVA